MADGDTVKMRLTFWRDGKKPGDVIDVPADEVHRWKGFAAQVGDVEHNDEPTTPTAEPEQGPPADSAKVDEWRAYAVQLGLEQGKADASTKQELRDFVAATTAGAQA
ncbi:hypothetical protein O3Q52_01610 [Streptomyces sp. ActVer]|uniref:hypothetical protein n=1 Tax=Streptomyces sp. ActVer TaxID=3014558 RepID=UPI0022B58614|nr:hypothetical protein [Streptomyces sp. ActVer]MCZ4506924.1 hypothetical protein [Streptomyces sp. ActVer]